MSDWNIVKFLCAILAVQAATLLVVGLNLYGIDLSLLRQVVCFAYLTFVPGLLLLRVLKLHGLGATRTVLYAAGLSLTTLMFAGAFLTLILPPLGVAEPIALLPLIVTLTIVVLVLSIAAFLRDRDFGGDASLDVKDLASPQALLLLLLPLLAILGTIMVNHSEGNSVLVVMILALCALALIVGFSKFLPKQLYPLAIFLVALSLLFHNSLISDSLTGWDIHTEKYLADAVINNGIWDISLQNVINSMLSIQILAPIYSIFLGMDIIWVYKIVYPLLFALTPVALYVAYSKQSNETVGFLSAFFFVSLVVYFTEMLALARQEIAELFLALIVLLLVDRSMAKRQWSLLFCLFTFSLVVSHYAVTFIFMGLLAVAWALLLAYSRLTKEGRKDLNRKLTPLVIIAFVVFCALWYTETSNANPLRTAIYVTVKNTATYLPAAEQYLSHYSNPSAEVPTPGGSSSITPGKTPDNQPMTLIEVGAGASAMHKNYLYMLLFTQAMIALGLLLALFFKKPWRFSREFYTLGLVTLGLLVACLVVPLLASSMNTTRLYQLALVFLAPFFIAAWIGMFQVAGKLLKLSEGGTLRAAVALLSVFLVVYLLFNSGLIFEFFQDVPMSYSLNTKGSNVSYALYNSMEVSGAEWTLDSRQEVAKNEPWVRPVYSDTWRMLLLQDWNPDRSYEIPGVTQTIPPGSYIYFGTYNAMDDKIVLTFWKDGIQRLELIDTAPVVETHDRIYTNGGAEVYY